ncbi:MULTISPECIES: hypothetical protein [unclassified Bradyrhizobium]|uniref:hypothetical protein n=1 Tax=unclassified Bradyrhizobium TaxID=2631580 RepID=UPI001BAB5583|nr:MULTISPECIES: hypothetical protein [unclassified Bradyrhizobium]MBR1207312.1 hypothetical protein [Bradyrhizobium sp. AUGA SZCCT0124]MBR1316171.1 hypothetical protein [Bradyrhizobium sp. AUGA SZCCT0051]MBR1343052.1 hypothetical protein [Bradyrhizobium sp. AUGA SZCCT0105]MBR1357528.1 hypothetical protein [Bradyrhizobium sp. AUGA SZCCT0045]
MRLGLYGMIAIGVAGLYAYIEFDKRVNFRPIDARVSSVKEQCYMEKTEDNRSSTSDLLPCELVELLARHHPKWQGSDIKHKIEIRFAYISPVDGAAHESNLQLAEYPDNRQLNRGDIFPVQASRREANRTRANDWVDRWLGRHAPRHGSI